MNADTSSDPSTSRDREARASESTEPATQTPRPDEERRFLSYEGAVVPRFLALLWIAFLIWGVVYLIRLAPESMVEWFSRD